MSEQHPNLERPTARERAQRADPCRCAEVAALPGTMHPLTKSEISAGAHYAGCGFYDRWKHIEAEIEAAVFAAREKELAPLECGHPGACWSKGRSGDDPVFPECLACAREQRAVEDAVARHLTAVADPTDRDDECVRRARWAVRMRHVPITGGEVEFAQRLPQREDWQQEIRDIAGALRDVALEAVEIADIESKAHVVAAAIRKRFGLALALLLCLASLPAVAGRKRMLFYFPPYPTDPIARYDVQTPFRDGWHTVGTVNQGDCAEFDVSTVGPPWWMRACLEGDETVCSDLAMSCEPDPCLAALLCP